MSSASPRAAPTGAWVFNGGMAYRMQLFLYLKSCGRSELNTSNLWSGEDPTPA